MGDNDIDLKDNKDEDEDEIAPMTI